MSNHDINEFIRKNAENHTDREIAQLLAAQGIILKPHNVRDRRSTMGIVKRAGRPLGAMRSNTSGAPSAPKLDRGNLGKIAALLEKSGIPIDEIDNVQTVRLNTYQGLTKDAEGEVQIHDLEAASIVLKPKWAEGPAWPLVQQAEPVVVKVPVVEKGPASAYKTCVILPDPQIGFRRDMITDQMDPFHDERAISVALKVIEDLRPDVIVNLGDLLDLAEFSRFVGEASFARTTQASFNYAHKYLAMQRALCPDAEIILFEGNHDIRMQRWIKQNGMAAYGLQRANEPASWPVMSVPHLLRLDELGVKYIEGYPAASWYLNDRLKFKHGDKAGKRGTVANRIIDDERVSTIVGHTHHINITYKSVDTLRGQRTSFAATLGCLCRIDGAVPSTKSGQDSFGRPVKAYEDWQQAVGVVTYMEGDNPFALEHAYIHEGFTLFRGVAYFAEQL